MDNYTLLYRLDGELYTEGSPLIISEGSLFQDNINNRAEIRLRLCGLSEKPIERAELQIYTFDLGGYRLSDPISHCFRPGCEALPGGPGTELTLIAEGNSARSFSVSLISVLFADGSLWESGGALWEPLPEQEKLIDALGSEELRRQYCRDTGKSSVYAPLRYKDIWLCSCGRACCGSSCAGCGGDREKLFAALEPEGLKERSLHYRRTVEQQRRAINEDLARSRRLRRRWQLSAAAAAAVLFIVVLLGFTGSRNDRYFRSLRSSVTESLRDGSASVCENGELKRLDFEEPLLSEENYELCGTAYYICDGSEALTVMEFSVSGELYSDSALLQIDGSADSIDAG